MEDDNVIGDGQLTSSTAMAGHEAWRGRLNGAGNWKPDKKDPAPVYRVKFYSPVNITYIATQGAPDEDCWVTSFKLRYKVDQSSNFTGYPQVCSRNCFSWTRRLRKRIISTGEQKKVSCKSICLKLAGFPNLMLGW